MFTHHIQRATKPARLALTLAAALLGFAAHLCWAEPSPVPPIRPARVPPTATIPKAPIGTYVLRFQGWDLSCSPTPCPVSGTGVVSFGPAQRFGASLNVNDNYSTCSSELLGTTGADLLHNQLFLNLAACPANFPLTGLQLSFTLAGDGNTLELLSGTTCPDHAVLSGEAIKQSSTPIVIPLIVPDLGLTSCLRP